LQAAAVTQLTLAQSFAPDLEPRYWPAAALSRLIAGRLGKMEDKGAGCGQGPRGAPLKLKLKAAVYCLAAALTLSSRGLRKRAVSRRAAA
jgi:hypothetical protein